MGAVTEKYKKHCTRKLVTAGGQEFYGWGFGAEKDALCELVFDTSMVGYQEIISSPSYFAKAVVLTYPLVGNYGITDEDYEGRWLYLGALIVREHNTAPSNFRYTKTLHEVMEEHGIPGLRGVDTRAITRLIAAEGTQKALLTSAETPLHEALLRIEAYEYPKDAQVKTSCKKRWYARTAAARANIAVLDCGVSLGIIKDLGRQGCNVTVLPVHTSPSEILELAPHGLVISDGPGDPLDVPGVVKLIRSLRGRMPLFGIGLGQALIALAFGAEIYKMKTGHHGWSPVRCEDTGRIFQARQNHDYTTDKDTLADTGLKITHIDLQDGTVEGLSCPKEKILSVSYYPDPSHSSAGFDPYEEFITLTTKESAACQSAMI